MGTRGVVEYAWVGVRGPVGGGGWEVWRCVCRVSDRRFA